MGSRRALGRGCRRYHRRNAGGLDVVAMAVGVDRSDLTSQAGGEAAKSASPQSPLVVSRCCVLWLERGDDHGDVVAMMGWWECRNRIRGVPNRGDVRNGWRNLLHQL